MMTPNKKITLQLIVLIFKGRVTHGSKWKIASKPSSSKDIGKITKIFKHPNETNAKKFFK